MASAPPEGGRGVGPGGGAGDGPVGGRLRLATWNVEWMNALFDDAGRMREDAGPSARHGVTRADQLAGIAVTLAAVDADAVIVVEAPDTSSRRSTVRALEGFAAAAGLRTCRALTGWPSHTEQEIALLYDPGRLTARFDPQGDPGDRHAPRFDGTFRADLDQDGVPEPVRWARAPLELAMSAGDFAFRLIGVHAKSKAPHGARNGAEAARLGIDNRRKQIAQCLWLRRRIEAHLAAGDPLIVAGDFNDGPGLDDLERLFGQSGVDVVIGADAPPPLRLHDPHALMARGRGVGLLPTTARFWDRERRRHFGALLDFVMVSADLALRRPDWRIWHPFDDPAIAANPDLREALLAASDHFPVSLDLPLAVGGGARAEVN